MPGQNPDRPAFFCDFSLAVAVNRTCFCKEVSLEALLRGRVPTPDLVDAKVTGDLLPAPATYPRKAERGSERCACSRKRTRVWRLRSGSSPFWKHEISPSTRFRRNRRPLTGLDRRTFCRITSTTISG